MNRTAINNDVSAIPGMSLIDLKQAFEISKIKAAQHIGSSRIINSHVVDGMNLDCDRSMISKVISGNATSKKVLIAITQFIIAFSPELVPVEAMSWLQSKDEISQSEILFSQITENMEAQYADH